MSSALTFWTSASSSWLITSKALVLKRLRILSFCWRKFSITIKSLNSVWCGQYNSWFQFINTSETMGTILGLIQCENQPAQPSQSFGLPANGFSLLCLQMPRESQCLHWAPLLGSPVEMSPGAWHHGSTVYHSILPKNGAFCCPGSLNCQKRTWLL